MPLSQESSPLAKLQKAMRKGLIRREVTLSDGTVFELLYEPWPLAVEETIRKDLGPDPGSNEYALALLIDRARKPDGTRMFTPGQRAELRRTVDAQDLNALMLAVLAREGEPLDTKSAED